MHARIADQSIGRRLAGIEALAPDVIPNPHRRFNVPGVADAFPQGEIDADLQARA